MEEKVHALRKLLTKAYSEKVFPGCSFALVTKNGIETIQLGNLTYDPASPQVTENTIYDIASLTKVIAPLSVAQILIDNGTLALTDRVSVYIPEFSNDKNKEGALLSHLLTYTLMYDLPCGTRSLMTPDTTPGQLAERLTALHLTDLPGTRYLYSNITAFLLTQVIERVTARSLAELVSEKVLTPLGMHSTTFSPSRFDIETIAPTEITRVRGVVRGFVHDESTHFLQSGGITSGAAGLFAPVSDIAQFIQMTLNKGVCNNQRIFSENAVSAWKTDHFPNLLPIHTPLCWSDDFTVAPETHRPHIISKGGFTGCFMMANLEREIGLVLLSNSTYPERREGSVDFKKLKEELTEILSR